MIVRQSTHVFVYSSVFFCCLLFLGGSSELIEHNISLCVNQSVYLFLSLSFFCIVFLTILDAVNYYKKLYYLLHDFRWFPRTNCV